MVQNLKKGFSLVELLVVIAIIGILAAVGITAYSGYTNSAKEKATLANHAQILALLNSEFANLCIFLVNLFKLLLNSLLSFFKNFIFKDIPFNSISAKTGIKGISIFCNKSILFSFSMIINNFLY